MKSKQKSKPALPEIYSNELCTIHEQRLLDIADHAKKIGELIPTALWFQFAEARHETCPMCNGTGMLPKQDAQS